MEDSMKSRIMPFWGLMLCFGVVALFGAEIFVSPTGNDAAAGTLSAPLATLAAARDKADQLKAGNTPVTVYLRGGTYYLSAPVVFGSANSGTAAAPIVYTAYGTEKPVISGGIKVAGNWTVSSGSIMVTTIATGLKVDGLFLNGKRQVLARFPNYNANTVILNGYDAICLSRVGNWSNPGEGPGYLRGLHNNMWGGNSYKITGKNGTSLTQVWVGDNNRGNQVHATYRMVENIFEELDAPGEWFYRKSTGQLFFYPPAGTNLGTATIELASQDELLRLVGSSSGSASSVKYIQFNGITFTHTFRTLFSPNKPYEMIFKSDWGVARAGAVFIQNAENITIQNCLFDQLGGNGIFVSGYNRSDVIYNNVFNETGASCVLIMGVRSSVRCPNSWGSDRGDCNDRTPGPVDPVNGEFPEYITVSNNMMARIGIFEKMPAGIALSATQCDTLRHNTIYTSPRALINFNDGSWGGHVVEYNWLYDCNRETSDCGPFNAWGRDRVERWQNDPSAAKLDAWKTTIVRNNRFEAPNLDFGIDCDDQACNYLQYNNLCMGGGLKLQWNRVNTYINNILVNGASAQFHGVWTQSGHYGARNILVGSYIYQHCCFTGDVPSQVKANIVQWDSNCVYNNGSNPYVARWMGTTSEYSWSQWTGAGLDAHTKVADPMFTDVNKTWPNYQPKGDYTVKAGSPALALGFKNFPMDSFGVMIAGPVVTRSSWMPEVNRSAASKTIKYSQGRLSVNHDGDYRVTVLTALGRTVETLQGKGRTCFNIDTKSLGAGVFIAKVFGTDVDVTRRFVVK
jgi:hypothetical protein